MEGKTRDKAVAIIITAANNYPEFAQLADADKRAIAVAIETSCYEMAREKTAAKNLPLKKGGEDYQLHEYECAIRRISTHINPNSEIGTPLVVQAILDNYAQGDIDAIKAIQHLPSCELYPQASQNEREELNKRLEIKVERRVSVWYRCRRCKQKTCTFKPRQDRCGDEAQSIIYECIDESCGYRGK